jgi:hypothetical protein
MKCESRFYSNADTSQGCLDRVRRTQLNILPRSRRVKKTIQIYSPCNPHGRKAHCDEASSGLVLICGGCSAGSARNVHNIIGCNHVSSEINTTRGRRGAIVDLPPKEVAPSIHRGHKVVIRELSGKENHARGCGNCGSRVVTNGESHLIPSLKCHISKRFDGITDPLTFQPLRQG